MVVVHLTQNLRRFFPGLGEESVEGETVAEIVQALDARFPGLAGYLVMDDGSLRKHVHIFVNRSMVTDRQALSDAVPDGADVHVLQALSGG